MTSQLMYANYLLTLLSFLKFSEKLILKTLIEGHFPRLNYLLYSVLLLFAYNAVLSHGNWVKFQDLKRLRKKMTNLSFSPKCLAEERYQAQGLLKRSHTKRKLVYT